MTTDPTQAMQAMAGARYLNLESFRRDGTGVRTPVWFAAAGPVFYIYSTADSFKIKRIARNAAVRIAPCDMRGTASGPWIDATATIIDGAEASAGMALLDRKYFPWKQLIGLMARFRPRGRTVVAIRPAAA